MLSFCPPHTQGMDPFLCVVVCSLRGLVAIHPWMTLGEQCWGTSFPWGICQAVYGPSTVLAPGVFSACPSLCILGRSALFLSCHCPVALATATSVPFCLCVLHLMARCLATREGLGCPRSWELDHSASHGAGFPLVWGEVLALPYSPWQSFQMHC